MDIDYYELFGVEKPTETGAEDVEVTEPQGVDEVEEIEETTDTEELGEEEQEIADPVETDEEPASEDTAPTETKAKQSDEDNARFAAARRKAEAEKETAVAQARADAQKMVDDMIASSGFVNQYTGKQITTKAEYDSYTATVNANKRAELLRDAGMTEQDFGQFLSNLPEIKQAREAQEKANEIQKAATMREARAKVEESVREITKIDADIKSIDDVLNADNYADVKAMMQRGYTLIDAYKLTNFDKLNNRAVETAKKTTAKNMQSKTHMQQTKSRGAGSQPVPADIRAEYKRLMPNLTDAEIQKHYYKNK